MNGFKLSRRSIGKLATVKRELADVVVRALGVSEIDFGVIEGIRSIETQAELVAKGASQTMSSKHLTGDAVDLLAYIGSRASWEIPLYHKIADAMKAAAIEEDVGIRWGGAWHINDIRKWPASAEAAMAHYVATRRAQQRKPFIDAVHFELI